MIPDTMKSQRFHSLARAIAFAVLLLGMVSLLPTRAQDAPPSPPPPAPGVETPAALLKDGHRAALIRLHEEVDDMMLRSLKRRIDAARKAGCDVFVLDVDSPGGMAMSALEITRFIRAMPDQSRTVAYVNPRAFSAGAMIGLACRHVVMTHDGMIGGCSPIMVDNGEQLHAVPPTERAKLSAPFLADFDESARLNGFNPDYTRPMVVLDARLDELVNTVTAERRMVTKPDANKLLATEITNAEGKKVHPWRFERTVVGDREILVAKTSDALEMKLAQAQADTEQQLLALVGTPAEPLRLDMNWSENATVWLTQTWVRGMLFVAMLVLAYIEFSHPGVSIPGVLAVACLVLLVGAPFLTGLAQTWEIILVVLGAGIIVVDLLFYGGIGLLAIPGFVLLAIGLVASFVPSDPAGGWMPNVNQFAGLQRGLGVVLFGSLISLGIFFALSRYLYMTPGFKRLQLAPAVAAPDAVVRDATATASNEAVFVGALGQATSDLRPAGKARFGGHLIDVVAQGEFISAGTSVVVIEVSGFRVMVRQARDGAGAGSATTEGTT